MLQVRVLASGPLIWPALITCVPVSPALSLILSFVKLTRNNSESPVHRQRYIAIDKNRFDFFLELISN